MLSLRAFRRLSVLALVALIAGLLHSTVTSGASASPSALRIQEEPPPLFDVSGTVTLRGEPLPGVPVRIVTFGEGTWTIVAGWTTTDAAGAWSIPVTAGRYRAYAGQGNLEVLLPGDQAPNERDVVVTDRDFSGIDADLTGHVISGRVMDRDGVPVAADVQLVSGTQAAYGGLSCDVVSSLQTTSSGHYAFVNVPRSRFLVHGYANGVTGYSLGAYPGISRRDGCDYEPEDWPYLFVPSCPTEGMTATFRLPDLFPHSSPPPTPTPYPTLSSDPSPTPTPVETPTPPEPFPTPTPSKPRVDPGATELACAPEPEPTGDPSPSPTWYPTDPFPTPYPTSTPTPTHTPTATATPTSVPTATPVPSDGPRPVVLGVPKVGGLLIGLSWPRPGTTVARQWLRDGQPISGATGTLYAVRTADKSTALAFRVTHSRNGAVTSVATSRETRIR